MAYIMPAIINHASRTKNNPSMRSPKLFLNVVFAFNLHSSNIGSGIDRIAKKNKKGSITASSKYPRKGIKSGMISTGDRAYAIATAIMILDHTDTSGCLNATSNAPIVSRKLKNMFLNVLFII